MGNDRISSIVDCAIDIRGFFELGSETTMSIAIDSGKCFGNDVVASAISSSTRVSGVDRFDVDELDEDDEDESTDGARARSDRL